MTDKEETNRDKLWEHAYSHEYNCAYAVECAKYMLKWWMKWSLIARLLTAFFTSTSAIAGWALWQSETGKTYWMFLAGIAAVVSIVDGVLGSQEKVKRYTELNAGFVRLTQNMRAILDDIAMNAEFAIDKMHERYESARTRYAELIETYPVDLFLTDGKAAAIQTDLNERRKHAS